MSGLQSIYQMVVLASIVVGFVFMSLTRWKKRANGGNIAYSRNVILGSNKIVV